jgi:Na+(H+)/acetate symporter ActP
MIWGFVFGVGFIASPINAGAIAMVAGFVIVPLVSLVTPKPDKVEVDKMFKDSYSNLHAYPVDAD